MTLDKPPKRLYTHEKLIICEGKMDRLIIKRLVKEHSIQQNFDLFDAGSKDSIHSIISEAIVSGIPKTILIIADNDDNPKKAFEYIKTQIEKGGLSSPSKPKQLQITALPVDIFMLPDTDEVGAIELLALKVFTKKMPYKACVDKFVECITEGKWLPQQADKLALAAYVAGSKNKTPDISMADYFGNGVVDIPDFYKDPTFDTIRDYLIAFSKV